MKKSTILLLLVLGLFSISYGQAKWTPALQKAAQSRQSDEKISVIITMASQYDAMGLDVRTQFMSRKTRTRFVTEELKQFSQNSQADLLQILNEDPNNVSDINAFWIFNGISCKATLPVIQTIAARPDVRIVDIDEDYATEPIQFEKTQEENTRDILWNIQQIKADQVWNYNGENDGYTGKNIVIAVLDSGVNYKHTDLQNRMWWTTNASNQSVCGYNFVMNTYNPMDDFGNGTLVAGIIVGDGSSGTATGIAKDAKIMALKTANSGGETSETKTCNGIEWAVEHDADIIVISACEIGIAGRASYRTKMVNLLNAGILAITSAGDQGQKKTAPLCISAPSNCPSPWYNPDEPINGGRSANLCVGATNRIDYKTYTSSFGPVAWTGIDPYNDYPYTAGSTTEVGHIKPDVTAPGAFITSTNYKGDPQTHIATGYTTNASGTALSAAHVAAVAAMMLEADSELTPAEIDRILETTAVKCEGLVTKNNYYGAGRIDALEAINAIKATVNAPTNLTATANNNEVTLQWTASNASSYDIYCNEELIAQNISGTSYTDNTNFSGHHCYYLKSHGSISPKSSYAYVFVDPEGPVVNNLSATVNNRNVTLSWQAPTAPSEMRYGTSDTKAGQKGEDNKPTYWAQRFTPATLMQYAGSAIDSLSFYFVKNGTYDLYIYNGNPNGTDTQLFHTTVTPTQTKVWTSVAVTPAVAIDHTRDLWIVARAPMSIAAPAAYCNYDNDDDITGYANLLSPDGKNWWTYGYGNSWMMKAILSTSNYTYNVLRNGTTKATGLTALSYTDNNVPAGTYQYTITTNYNNGNSTSFPSTPVRVDVETRFTVTFNPGNGTCGTSSMQQTTQGAAITLPSATPSSACQAEGYTFAGWCTEIVEAEAEEPELLLGGSSYTPTDNITLYAVYKNVQGQQGWSKARTIQNGDSIRIVCTGHNIEFSNSTGVGAAFNVNTPLYPFTVVQVSNGYRLKDANGRFLYKTSYGVDVTNSSSVGIWNIEIINGTAIVRTGNYQLLATKVSSSSLFNCLPYDPSNLSNDNKNIQFYRYTTNNFTSYDHSPNCGTILQAPTITPYADGIYLDPVTITMTSTASGAIIRYTLDGSEPTATSTLYVSTGKPQVSSNTTVKARAFKSGYSNSAVTTMNYEFATAYSSISAFKSAANTEEIAKITSTMRVTQQFGRYLYICDNTGGLLVFDDYNMLTDSFVDGDYIGNVFGRYKVVNGQPMLVLMHNITKTGENEPVTPTKKTVTQVLNNYDTYDAQLMLFEGVKFTRSQDAYDPDTLSFIQGGKKLITRNKFGGVDCPIDNTLTYDVVGIMGMEGTKKRLYPRSNDDIRMYYDITCATTENGTVTANKNAAAAHSTITLTITPNNNYHLLELYYYSDDPNTTTDIDQTTLSFEMPSENITIVAVFEENNLYTVNFNPGSGNCDITSLTESNWNSGIVLPDATPSSACTAQGYSLQGWTDHIVEETMARPILYYAGNTYHPTENQTLYAVYAVMGDEWQEVLYTNSLYDGEYVIATKVNNIYYFLYQEGATTSVKAKRMSLINGIPTKYMTQPDPQENMWTIEAISSTHHSITYRDADEQTFYLKAYSDSDFNTIEVTTSNPNAGWVFTNNTSVNTKKGLLARFPNPVPDKAIRYLDISNNFSLWYNNTARNYIGEMHLFRGPSNIYSTFPVCQSTVATPEFLNVPEGLVLDNNYLVTITCETQGATIYYTTDGSTPNNSSTVYTAPFAINDNCTVNAVAYLDGVYSAVATQSFNFPARFDNIAAFKQAYINTNNSTVVSQITGNVQFVFGHGNEIFLRDETAGLLVRDINGIITNTYNNGDIIQGGIVGTYRKNNQQPTMIPTVNPATGITGTPVEPIVATAFEIKTNYDTYDAQLVTIVDAVFAAGYDFNANASATANDGTAIYINNHFETLTIAGDAGEHDDITGLVGKHLTDNSYATGIFPRDNNDLVRYYNITADPIVEHAEITLSTDHAHVGDMVSFNITPNPGYVIAQIRVIDSNDNDIAFTGDSFEMPADNVTITVTLTQLEYTITISADPNVGGTITNDGTVISGANTFHYGDVLNLTATPNPGYRFHGWYVNNSLIADNPYHHTVTGYVTIVAKFSETTTTYDIQVTANGNGTVEGGGSFLSGTTITVTATPDGGNVFESWTENGNVVSTDAAYTFVVTRPRNLVANFVEEAAGEQTVTLSAGWSWMSAYVECSPELFSALQEGIAAVNSTAMIKDMVNSTMLQNGDWSDSDLEFLNEKMYMTNMANPVTVTLNAAPANPAEHPITLGPGWNWIGFISTEPMTVEEALAGITANNGDMIKNMSGAMSYTGGSWQGNLDNLEPGSGYMYNNTGEQITLTYPSSAKGVIRSIPVEMHWNTNVHEHATNLVMMATLDESQFQMADGNYEIGAFVDGECRGSARLQSTTNGYVAFLVIHGDAGEAIHFMLYDVTNAVEVGMAEEQISYVANAISGSIEAPVILHFRGTMGVNEAANSLRVFPNPTHDWITVEGEGLQSVTLCSITGQTLLRKTIQDNSTRLSVEGFAPGLYLIQMVKNDGTTVTRKLEIK